MSQARYRAWAEAPRWAKVPSALRDMAFLHDVSLHMQIEKGWIREKIRFEVTGNDNNVLSFINAYNRTIKEYNSE